MNFSIEELTPDLECAYTAFHKSLPDGMLFGTLKYRDLLKNFLDAEPHYWIARDANGNIVAALPSFLSIPSQYGRVLNSLPFYGSHGGVLARENIAPEIGPLLMSRFNAFANEQRCVASTIITSPLEGQTNFYETSTGFTHRDTRIGQITDLPAVNQITADDTVMGFLHQKTRNMVRKAQKSDLSVTKDCWPDAITFLAKVHHDNLIEMGGRPKPHAFFQHVSDIFDYGSEYQIYTAWKNSSPVAALLLFYHNDTVEYFTPVIIKEYRSDQPMSLLIFHAMIDAVSKGYRRWNWGGTWKTQEGVYHFKKSWGAKDRPYHYFTRVMNHSITQLSKSEITGSFPNFFVLPFDQIPSEA